MADPKLVVKIRMAWWWPVYKWGVVITAGLTGRTPDWAKVKYWCLRATTLTVDFE